MKASCIFMIMAGMMAVTGLMSCGSSNNIVSYGVGYQAVRLKTPPTPESVQNAKISVTYTIDADGNLNSLVSNLTDDVMTIDQTRSFLIEADGRSTTYYDPTVRTTTVGNFEANTTSTIVNVGDVAWAVGIDYDAHDVFAGRSKTTGQLIANSTQVADLPQVTIGPRGHAYLSRTFKVDGVGEDALRQSPAVVVQAEEYEQSPVRFKIYISYSFDDGKSYEKLESDMYVSTQIKRELGSYGRVNESVREILKAKPDAVREGWWTIAVSSNVPDAYDRYSQGFITDYR